MSFFKTNKKVNFDCYLYALAANFHTFTVALSERTILTYDYRIINKVADPFYSRNILHLSEKTFSVLALTVVSVCYT